MPHKMRLLPEIGLVVLRYGGRVGYREIETVLDELVELPGFRRGLHLIADFRDCEVPITGRHTVWPAARGEPPTSGPKRP